MSRASLLISVLALLVATAAYLLFAGQKQDLRQLRAMVLSDRADAQLNAQAGAAAEQLYAQVAEIDPASPNLWRKRALARMMAGNNVEAVAAARQHLQAHPDDAGMSALLGAAQILNKDYDGADQTLTAALKLSPQQRDLVQNLSELRRLQQRPADAAKVLDDYLAAHPDDGFFQFKRAMADVAGALPAARRKEIAEALAGGKASAGVYVVAAAIDFKDGKPDAAKSKLQEAANRSNGQDMNTMLQDEFFRPFITIGAPQQPTPSSAK